MKRIARLTLILFLVTLTINAQGNKKKQRKGADFTPEQVATLKAKKMALTLDLTSGQQKQVYNLMKEDAIERERIKNEMKAQREAGTEISSDKKYEMAYNKLDKQIAHKAEMKNILSKDQYEKWSEMMQKRMEHGKKKMSQKSNKKGMRNDSPRNGK